MKDIYRVKRRKLRGEWLGTMIPLNDQRMTTITDLSLKIDFLWWPFGRTIVGTCSYQSYGSSHQFSVRGKLIGVNSLYLEATMTNPTYPGHKPHVMKVYAGVMSENVITGRIMYIWNSDNNEFTAFAINLKKK